MEFKQSIFRRGRKSTDDSNDTRRGKWIVRLKWEDATGQIRVKEKQFKSHNAAINGVSDMKRDIARSDGDTRGHAEMTFADLVEIAKSEFYYPAIYERGLITSGVKSYTSVSAFLKTLNEYFGKMKVRRIRPGDITRYREWRRKLGNQNPSLAEDDFREVAPSTINRELSVCRRLLKYAYDEGWTEHYVFPKARAIHKKLEIPRNRILTDEEVDRLLAACEGTIEKEVKRKRREIWKESPGEIDTYKLKIKADNPFIKPMILLAVDSGLRRGEILALRWADIDLAQRCVTLRKQITKTERERTVGLTDRTIEALMKVHSATTKTIFPKATKRGWEKVKTIAQLEDIRFHDLRRTASTVLVRDLGMSIEYAAKMLGHEEGSAITLKHYVSIDKQAMDLITERLNDLHRSRATVEEVGNIEN